MYEFAIIIIVALVAIAAMASIDASRQEAVRVGREAAQPPVRNHDAV